MTLLLGVEHSLTWKTMTAILSMINTLFGKNVVPATKYKIFKTLQQNEEIITYHLFCDDCLFYVGARNNSNIKGIICENCGDMDQPPNISFFITLNMAAQLKTIFQDLEVQQILIKRFENAGKSSNKNTIENITDGKIYKKLSTENNPLSDSFNFSYTFNTDGCQASKSSKVSTWPIYAIINELPPKLQSKHMIISSIWVSKKEPNMQLFLKPFVMQANELADKGIEWKLGDRIITSKFVPVCAVVDSVARCKMLNMKQYNGTYGCTFCEHPTESVDGYRKYTISTNIPKDRTDESIKENMNLAGQSEFGRDVMGVWGPSPLMNLKYFDIANGMSPDYMHFILLGTVKQHTEIVLSSFDKEYYIGNPNQLQIINERLMSFKHPTCITRSPRHITEKEMWKATEWRSWLLFYSLICLKGILPEKYLNHLALLVEAMNILLSEKIDKKELRIAGFLLIRYVTFYQEYFGKGAMTYNIHLLLHMEKSVSNLGPLSCHNTFTFENENHFVLKMEKSPTHLPIQVARRYIFQKSLPSFESKLIKSNGFKTFCERNLTGRLKNTFKVNECTLIGRGKAYELNIMERALVNTTGKCRSFNKFIYNNNRYTSSNYRLCQKINDSLIILKNGKMGVIKEICYFDTNESDKQIYIFYEELIGRKKYFHSTKQITVHNIEECTPTVNLQVCKPEMIMEPCMLTEVNNQYYIIKIPRGCYND
ncbi:uncharacterized protein LOC106693488 isoform X2 [Microplitis demolitor]|nr:uncharacterized protein LOC106693488 isoform X2 [Microplitis demolitor]